MKPQRSGLLPGQPSLPQPNDYSCCWHRILPYIPASINRRSGLFRRMTRQCLLRLRPQYFRSFRLQLPFWQTLHPLHNKLPHKFLHIHSNHYNYYNS